MNYKIFGGGLLAATLWQPTTVVAQEDDAHHQMDEIVVTATPLRRTVDKLAQPVTVLSGEELRTKTSTSIGETLSTELGVSSTYFGPVASRPVIRGQYGERVRVLSNGLDAMDASALSEDHQTTVEGMLADRIEIIRGPATLLYGSGAAGGLVNVVDSRIAERPMDAPFAGGVAVGADTAVNNRDIALQGRLGAGMFVFTGDYFYRSTDNVEIPGFAESQALMDAEEEEEHMDGDMDAHDEEEEEAFGELENSDSETDGGSVGVSLVGDRGFLGASFSAFNSDYGVPGAHHHHEEEDPMDPGAGAEEEEETVRIDLEQTRVDLRGEYRFEGAVLDAILFRGAVNDYSHTELEGDEIGTIYDNQAFDGRLEVRHAQWGPLVGAVGIQYENTDFDAIGDEAFVPASETKRASLFIFEELSLSDDFILQGSARFEDQTIDGPTITESYDDNALGASLGAVWQLADSFRISANWALTERHPTSTELYADGPHLAAQRYEVGSVTQGNGILDKEVSNNVDLTLHGDHERFEWTLTGFVNSIDDYILLRPTADELDELQVFNFDQADAEFMGFEAEGIFEFFDDDVNHLHLRAFADYVEGEESLTNANLPRIPPLRVGLGLHGGWDKWGASVDAIVADDQTDVAENELPTEGYTLLNAGVSYTFSDPGLFVYFRGTNLLDEEIRQHTSSLKDVAPLPGISWHLGVRYDF